MSIATHDLRLLEHLMKEEAETLESLSQVEEKLRKSVLNKDWANMDETLQNVKNLSEKVSQSEKIRAIVYQKIKTSCKASPEETFSDILIRIPPEDQGNLASLHRKICTSVEKVKCLTEGLDIYINSAMNTMDRILEEVFPSRRNKVYTRTGESSAGGQPMVISHNF